MIHKTILLMYSIISTESCPSLPLQDRSPSTTILLVTSLLLNDSIQSLMESGEAERTDYSDEADIVNIGTAMGIPAVDSDNQWCMLNIRA